MATRETQDRIISTALTLFNQSGTKAISTNRIADECGISRGNLHYHFRTKEEIIQTIFQQIDHEMQQNWSDDHLHPTMEYMHDMFERQMKLIWHYRFFYLELNTLLQNDARLKVLFFDNRKKRVREVELFFKEMIQQGFFDLADNPDRLASILLTSWLVSDQWPQYLAINEMALNEENISKGFDLILQVFQPYFTEKAIRDNQKILLKRSNPSA